MARPDSPEAKKTFRVQMLGTPAILWGDQSFALPRRQARALIFRLANRLQPLSREQLSFLFWPDTADTRARQNLSRLLSYTRSALPDSELLLADDAAISLNRKKVASDAVRFIRLAESKQMNLLTEAASLYRGTFLSGFNLPGSAEFDTWLTSEQQGYERRYLSTLSSLIEFNNAAGDHETAIGHARRYLSTDPLAEEIHAQLITLLAASGDFRAAQRQYEECALILERELGVKPLPETRAAYDAVRRGTLRVHKPRAMAPAWTTLPSLAVPLTGREEAHSRLEAAWGHLRNGGVIFISGEAGIGKSRLMQEFTTGRQELILAGNSHPGTQLLAYQPIVEALRLAAADVRLWEDIPPIWLAEATALMPEIRAIYPDLPRPIADESEQAQARLFEALTQIVLGLAEKSSHLLLCFDDLHSADSATLGWLQYLVGRLDGSRVCIVAAYRIDESEGLREVQQTLQRVGLMDEVVLGGLSPKAVEHILSHVPGPIGERSVLATRIHSATGGNPFFVLEIVRALLEGDLLTAPPARLPLPQTVQEAIAARLRSLTPMARQVLETAAVLSPSLEFDLMRLTAGRADLEIIEGLDELTQRQLLLSVDDTFQFHHDLIRAVVYDTLSFWRRRLLHRRAGDALGVVYSRDKERAYARRANHYELAGERAKALENYRLAARAAEGIYANDEAIRHFQRALELLASTGQDKHLKVLVELYEGLGRVLRRKAEYEAAEKAYLAMYEASVKLGNSRTMAQALLGLGQIQDSQRRYQESLESAEAAESLTAGDKRWPEYGLALFAKAWALFRLGRLEQALVVGQEALDRAVDLDSPSLMARSHNTLGAIYKHKGQYQLSQQHQEKALELFESIGDRRRVAGMLSNLGETARFRGDYATAITYYAQALQIAEEIGERDWLPEFFGNMAQAQIGLGHFQQAEQTLVQALEMTDTAVTMEKVNLYQWLSQAYLGQGKGREAADSARIVLRLAQEANWPVAISEAWRLLSLAADQLSTPITIGGQEYDSAACLQESRRAAEALGPDSAEA